MRITAERAVGLIAEEVSRANEPLRVYWHQMMEGSRDEFAKELETAAFREGVPMVPIVLRRGAFDNPNALLSDVGGAIEENRRRFRDVPGVEDGGCICVVLLTRGALGIPQVSSPMTLPDWFPILPGREVLVPLLVFGDAIDVALLNAEEARVGHLSELLFGLEEALVGRLIERVAACPGRLDSFLGRVESVGDGKKRPRAELLEGFRRRLGRSGERRAYRPSVRHGDSLVALLIRLVVKSSPDELAKVGASLADAVGLPEDVELRRPMLSVLFRPSGQQGRGARAGHAMLLGVYGAYQFITGAAHAGEYPAFSVNLIHATSRDLRRVLQDSRELVGMLGGREGDRGGGR